MPTILITGASRGLGLEFARQYAAAGWRVLATCRNPDAAAGLAAVAGDVAALRLDVGDFDAVDRLAADLAETSIDVLLLNAGIHPQWTRPPVAETDYDAWPEAFRINCMAVLRVAVAFAGHVARSERKIIAAMSSGSGSIARHRGGNYVYASTKAALNLCLHGLSVELAPRGIAVVALAPGGVRTDMNRNSARRLPGPVVAQLRAVLDSVGPGDSGRFINYDGTDVPW